MLPQEALRLYKDFSKGSLEIRDMSHLPHVRDGDTDSGLKDIEITGEREKSPIHVAFVTAYCCDCSISLLVIVHLLLCLIYELIFIVGAYV